MADAEMTKDRSPAVTGWFDESSADGPSLTGQKCDSCGVVMFPPTTIFCRNPRCSSEAFTAVRLSRRGTIWSYTDARYQPPPPYIPRHDVHQPFVILAVQLEAEGMVVLGQAVDGVTLDDVSVGQAVELVIEELYSDEATEFTIWKWRPEGDPA